MTPVTEKQFMPWQDSWLVGIQAIDVQHKHLVTLVNQLHDAMKKGQGRQATGAVLNSLVEYTKAHFSTEERLLQLNGYPEFLAHKMEHERLTTKVVNYQKSWDAGEIALSVELLSFLSDWLRSHILGVDKKYVPHLQSKGVK